MHRSLFLHAVVLAMLFACTNLRTYCLQGHYRALGSSGGSSMPLAASILPTDSH
ncbi:hypothetical protein PF010_g18545 [Phytophthora fragariae]|uniref:RxLR effector protein n=1 Tax=Phytophthora fragariae TaxID=53985 RepID=A0A6A3SJ00_9STRA|nr:hypothetical protein PF003_g40326 [Phytophthora fragariae]KAE9090544.1 hypothetical protein PF010_g18545 [Phytophthora fragariae]KAE9117728.1 hypothetical protein PF006_g18753 [Phytophthora fragariae]KAE9227647.1 hypothetical protein PF002_g13766 [Phytophthora fragariae]